MYLFRQLYYFKDGSRHGSMGALMKGVVAQITQDDMLAIAAYVGSLPPGTEESTSAQLHITGSDTPARCGPLTQKSVIALPAPRP